MQLRARVTTGFQVQDREDSWMVDCDMNMTGKADKKTTKRQHFARRTIRDAWLGTVELRCLCTEVLDEDPGKLAARRDVDVL